jgi:hypothetical protein
MCPYSKYVLDSNHDLDEQKWYLSPVESHITRKKHGRYKASTLYLEKIPRGMFHRRNIYNGPFFIIMEQFSSGKVMSLLGTIAVTYVSAAIGGLESPLPSYLSVHSPITCTGFSQKKL